MNESKIRSPRFWGIWSRSGAVGNMASAVKMWGMPYTRAHAASDRHEFVRLAKKARSSGDAILAGLFSVEAGNDRVGMQKAHKINLGPYSVDNPAYCLDCGLPRDRWVVGEACSPEQSPVIELPANLDPVHRRRLEAKLAEYRARQDANRYQAPEVDQGTLCKIAVLEAVLGRGCIRTFDFHRELVKKHGFIDPYSFNNACGVINDYITTGGQKVHRASRPFAEIQV
jgi:hypothetical protein